MSRALSPTLLVIVALVGLAVPAGAEEAAEPDLSTPQAVRRALGDPDPEVRLLAARAARTMQDSSLIAPLARLLGDDDVRLREAAVDALVAREGPKDRKGAAQALAARLRPLAREPDEADLAREALLVPALHDLAQPATIDRLLDVHAEAPAAPVRARLRAVANVPSAEAVEALIDFGSRRKGGDGHRRGVREALVYATGVKMGADPDAWRAWWREAKATFDFEAAARARATERARRDR